MYLKKIFLILLILGVTTNTIYANSQRDSYKQGYSDGCYSAKESWRKDTYAYNRNNLYAKGWDTGKRQCKVPKHTNNHRTYDIGYRDGCRTAKGNYTQDRQRYRHNRSYRNGWKNGSKECSYRVKYNRDKYKLGYDDGCETARYRFLRDDRLYNRSVRYRDGWDNGERRCR